VRRILATRPKGAVPTPRLTVYGDGHKRFGFRPKTDSTARGDKYLSTCSIIRRFNSGSPAGKAQACAAILGYNSWYSGGWRNVGEVAPKLRFDGLRSVHPTDLARDTCITDDLITGPGRDTVHFIPRRCCRKKKNARTCSPGSPIKRNCLRQIWLAIFTARPGEQEVPLYDGQSLADRLTATFPRRLHDFPLKRGRWRWGEP